MPARTFVADPKLIDDPSATVAALTPILALDATEASELTARLGDPDSRFAYVARRVDDATATAIEELSLPGLLFIDEPARSEEHTSELQSLMRISYAVFCFTKKTNLTQTY